jgi:hypothetical protein
MDIARVVGCGCCSIVDECEEGVKWGADIRRG